MEVHNCTNQAVIGPAFCTAHGPGKKFIAAVTASNNDVVKKMPVFGSGMHPSCFELVTLLEEGVGNDEIELRTYILQTNPIAVELSCAMFANDITPSRVVSTDSCVEVAH